MTIADLTQIVTFRLGDDLFAADIYAVERVLRYQAPTSIPNVPAWIQGVIEYQSRVVPVIDLRARFELAVTAPTGATRILIFNANGEWIAAVVDAVVEVSVLDPAKLAPPPPLFQGLAGEYLRGIVRRNDALIVYLDVTRLLSTNERLVFEHAAQQAARHG